MTKRKQIDFEYAVLDVFAAAVRAYHSNKGYFKDAKSTFAPEDLEMQNAIITVRNFDLIKQYLSDKVKFSTTEIEEANSIIAYYQSKLLVLMSGKLNGYSIACCTAANKKTITDPIELGLIASLPKAYRHSVAFDAVLESKERATAASSHFGKKGDSYEGQAIVISSIYSQKWFRYFHTARDTTTNNVVNFSSDKLLEIDSLKILKGRVKDHVEGNVTRLNYVKVTDANS